MNRTALVWIIIASIAVVLMIVAIVMCLRGTPFKECLLYNLHILLVAFLFSIPFHPCKVLKYTLFIPLLVVTIWMFSGGLCPLTKLHGTSHTGFFRGLIKSLTRMKVSQATSDSMQTFGFMLITVIAALRYGRCMCKIK